MAHLRDMVYLDWDRTRTLAGQLLGDNPVPGAGADVRFYQSASETPSLQAETLQRVEKHLGPDVLTIDGTFDPAGWKREAFHDGQFVRVTGVLRLLDYPWTASLMETMPRMLKVTHRAELLALKQRRDMRQTTQKEVDDKVKEQQAQLQDLQNWKMEELTGVIRELYGDTVRLKLLPNKATPEHLFVGTAPPKWFREPVSTLAQRYGADIDANWTVLGVVNINATNAQAAAPLPTGNAMEDMFERLAIAVNNIHRVASAPPWPTVSLTPVAIYRG